MPSVTQSPTFSSSKKRRRDDSDGGGGDEVQVPCSPQYHHERHHTHGFSTLNNNERLVFSSSSSSSSSSSNHKHPDSDDPPVFSLPRKVIPLPVSKRFRTSDDHEKQQHDRQHPHRDENDSVTSPGSRYQSTFPHAHPEYSTPPISPQIQPYQARSSAIKPSSALLVPCHICHRKPTKKSDLDSFAGCMGCGQRTCFVCIRQCQGWLSGGGSGDDPRIEDTTAAEEQRQQYQQQHNFSASFTMRDVDDDMDHHELPSANHRPQKPHRAQNKGGGGSSSSSGSSSIGDSGSRGGGSPEEGWSGRGHREVICSRCCVERGSEGDVVCLGCLAGMEGA